MPTDDDRFAITCNHCGEVYDKSDDARHDCQSDDDLDRAAPWAGYGWKIDELLDRAQAAEDEVRRFTDGIRTKAEAWDRDAPDAMAYRVTADFRNLLGDDL